MAGYKGHIAGGLVSGLAYVGLLTILPGSWIIKTSGLLSDWQLLTAVFIMAMLFGLWPDIDTNSKGQDIFYGVAFGLDVLLIWQGYIELAAFLGLLAMTPIVGKHRGWTHSRWAMILIPLPFVLVPYMYKSSVLDTCIILYGAAVSGYFSHLLLDGQITRHIRIKSRRD